VSRLRAIVGERGEAGYSLVESLIVMAIMSVVMTGVTTVFVSGSGAQLDANRRFQAQQDGRVALDKMRREIHCASSGAVTTVAGSPTTYKLTLTLPSACGSTISWCSVSVGGSTTRFALYRQASSSCGSGSGTRWVDYLTTANVFPTYTAQSLSSLASLRVDLPISVKQSSTIDAYELADTIYLRNSSRS
jgi:prepilin-type N-terminal cleavage/methylation domain-containing protein